MSREVISRSLPYLLALFFSTFYKASVHVLPDDCLKFDIAEFEGYLSKFNLENVPTIDMMIGGFKCPVNALPFGALKSDWARLLLVQRAQPKGSLFAEKLARLFRILVIAYFRMEEHLDVTEPDLPTASSVNARFAFENTGNVHSEEETRKSDNGTIADARGISEIPESFASSTASTSWDATSEHESDEFDVMRDNIPSIAFSPVGGQTTFLSTSERIDVEEENAVERVTVSTNIADVSGASTERETYLEITNNYSSNDIFTEETTRTNGLDGTETEVETDERREFFLQKDMLSTINDYMQNRDTDFVTKESITGKISTESSTLGYGTSRGLTLSDMNSIDNFSIATSFVVADTSRTMTPLERQRSTTKHVEKETGNSVLAVKLSTTILDDDAERDFEKTAGRGDFPVFYDPSNFVDSEENIVGNEGNSKFATIQHRNNTDTNVAGFENISSSEVFDVETTSEQSRIYSGNISDGGVADSTESFNQNPWDRRKYSVFQILGKSSRNLPSSTIPPNKIKKPTIFRKPPLDNEFWKHIVVSQNFATTAMSSTSVPIMENASGTNGSSSRSKKRGSLNTNVEKNFRWFYNLGQEDEKYRDNAAFGRRGINIECNGGKRRRRGGRE